MRKELVRLGKDKGLDVVRVHSDCDPSIVYPTAFSQYLIDEKIYQTDKGSYRPQNNARTERRIRMLAESVRAAMIKATAGMEVYDKLWGVVQQHVAHCINRHTFSDGRCPYTLLTGKAYKWTNDDHIFGASGIYHIPKEQRSSKMKPTGDTCIWVGRSMVTTDSSVVVPIKWDSTTNTYELKTPVVATRCDLNDKIFPLREGPVTIKDKTLKKFLEKYNLPNYKVSSDFEEYQIDGEGPIWEVEAIQGKKGRIFTASQRVPDFGIHRTHFRNVRVFVVERFPLVDVHTNDEHLCG